MAPKKCKAEIRQIRLRVDKSIKLRGSNDNLKKADNFYYKLRDKILGSLRKLNKLAHFSSFMVHTHNFKLCIFVLSK